MKKKSKKKTKKAKKEFKMPKRVLVLDVMIDPIKKIDLKRIVNRFLKDKKKHFFATVNAEYLIEANENQRFKTILNYSDLNTADGIGVIWASKFLNQTVPIEKTHNRAARIKKRKSIVKWQTFLSLFSIIFHPSYIKDYIPERITGINIINVLSQFATKNEHSLYILGGREGVADLAKFELEKKYPKIFVAGTKCGFHKKGTTDKDWIKSINKSKADILLVGLGSPKQEYWIFKNMDKLKHVRIAVGIGGAIDYLAKSKTRAPSIIRKIGLEWLFRLYLEPWRFPRIRKATFKLIKLAYKEKIKNF